MSVRPLVVRSATSLRGRWHAKAKGERAPEPTPPHWITSLRALEADPSNPVGPNHVEPSTLAAMGRRKLVERVVKRGATLKLRRVTYPLTDAGRALLASLDGASLPGVEALPHV